MHRFVLDSIKIVPKFNIRNGKNLSILSKPVTNFGRTLKNSPQVLSKNRRDEVHNSHRYYQLPKTPEIIYMPHVLRWIKSKLGFKYLKVKWDPEFSEGAFIYGSTQAVCRITEIINTGQVDQLEGLMTDSAKARLVDDMSHRLTKNQRSIIVLRPQDIKILVPISVTLTTQGLQKICRVGLRILALKWLMTANDMYKLVLVALQSEFTRDYTSDLSPEWTISNFTVLECSILAESIHSR